LTRNRNGLLVVLPAAALLGAALLPAGLPAQSEAVTFTASQVSTGAKQFALNCSPCHGSQLEGGAGPPLTGANFKTLSTKVHATVSDIFTYMSTNMPLNNPASLKKSVYVAIMAFILSKNGYRAGDAPLTYAEAKSSKAEPVKP
jgi:mono/diheme cytochrome c family protein